MNNDCRAAPRRARGWRNGSGWGISDTAVMVTQRLQQQWALRATVSFPPCEQDKAWPRMRELRMGTLGASSHAEASPPPLIPWALKHCPCQAEIYVGDLTSGTSHCCGLLGCALKNLSKEVLCAESEGKKWGISWRLSTHKTSVPRWTSVDKREEIRAWRLHNVISPERRITNYGTLKH